MQPSLDERVGNLERDMEHLKAFAGPGQNEALSGSVAEIRTIVADIKRHSEATSARLANLELRQGRSEDRLDDINQRLDEHGHLLGEILSRLPKPTAPGDN